MSSSGDARPGYRLCHEDGHHRGAVPARPAGRGVCSDGARRPGRRGALDRGGQGWLRHIGGDREQGVAHARRRPPDRSLLSRPRHAQRADARPHRLRRQDVRPAGQRRRESQRPAARLAQPDLPAGERAARPFSRDQDLRDRPGPERPPRGRPLRVAHRQEARPLRLLRPGPWQRRHGRQRQHER